VSAVSTHQSGSRQKVATMRDAIAVLARDGHTVVIEDFTT
jgi:hypothetical protein